MNIVRRKEIFALFLGDLAVFFISLYLTLTFRFGELPSEETILTHFVPFMVLFLMWILISFIAGLYEKHTLTLKGKLPVILTRVQVANAVTSIAFFYFIPYFNITPKVILFIYLVVSLVIMVAWRMALAETLGRGQRSKALLIAHKNEEASALYHEINNNQRYGTHIVEWIDSSVTASSKEIVEKVRSQNISRIVADFADPKVNELMPVLYSLIFSGVEFDDIQELYEEVFDRVPLSFVNDTWFLENVSSSRKSVFDAIKRLMDITAAAIVGVISLVVYPFVYAAIKLDDGGPLFIAQERIGRNNKIIKILKFRSMTTDDKGNYAHEVGKKNKVTRIGAYLRKTRIDELPQLWNVIKGDISLIGPRPELPALVNTYAHEIEYYNVRHIVMPGLSGWAQIYGEHSHLGIGTEETKNKLSYDLYYIKNRSLFLDIKIALQTLKVLFSFVGR
jgi:exopolysaccharide biosynthesis polyprenyl glycosylphosphotransferase